MIERVRRQRRVRRDVMLNGVDDLFVRPPLGGRAGELGRLLEEAARAARSRRPVLVLLEGESGVGKTRLLEEMFARLRLDGFSIAGARGGSGSRRAWSGLLAVARGGLRGGPREGGRRRALAAFAEALPAWARAIPGRRPAVGLPLGRAMVEALRTAAEERPVVLALDDAQWLDRDTALGSPRSSVTSPRHP